MTHYSRKEWEAFAGGTLEKGKSGAMEEHLLSCELCAGEYLSFFSGEGAAGNVIELHPHFSAKVMKTIKGMETRRRERAKRRDVFYYSAAACLTLFLMFAGVFEGFAGIIPAITEARMEITISAQPANRSVIEFGWSDELLNSAVTLLDAMKSKGGEVLE